MGLKRVQHYDRPVVLPFEEATGLEIKEVLGIRQDRTLAMRTENGLIEIGDNERTSVPDNAELVDVPFHEYGVSREVAERLEDECRMLGERYRQAASFGYDPTIRRWWVRLPELPLPRGWNKSHTPVLVTVTDYYPNAAPDGFLISNRLSDRYGHAPAHYFRDNGRHPHLSQAGYGWFCLHTTRWQGDFDPRDGDSIAKYFTLIELALAKFVS
ncbi:MAG: hypothetical protein AMXMBFR81_23020 [Chthonomonas sp.]